MILQQFLKELKKVQLSPKVRWSRKNPKYNFWS